MNTAASSAIAGFLAGIGITLAVGASTASNSSGRFQITSAANYLAVLDTQTGQVWAGNFNQLGPGAAAIEFRTCPQTVGEVFRAKTD